MISEAWDLKCFAKIVTVSCDVLCDQELIKGYFQKRGKLTVQICKLTYNYDFTSTTCWY